MHACVCDTNLQLRWNRARVHVVGEGVYLRDVLVAATTQTFIRL